MGSMLLKLKNGVYSNTLKLIFQKSLSLLIGQVILLFLFNFILTPFVSSVYYAVLKMTGYSYVTVYNLVRFLLNPITLVILLLLSVILGLFLLFEIYFLVIFFNSLKNNQKIRLYRIGLQTLYQLLLSIRKWGIRLIPAAWLTLGVFNLPLLCFSLFKFRVLRFMAKEVYGLLFWIVVALLLISLIGMLLFRNSFIFNYSLLHKGPYKELRRNCRNRRSNKPIRTLFYFIPWNIFLSLIIILIYAFSMVVLTLLTAAIPDRTLAIATFISVNDSMNEYLLATTFLICTVGNLALFTQLFYHYGLVSDPEMLNEELLKLSPSPVKSLGKKSYRRIFKYSLLLLLVINVYSYAHIIFNGSPLDYMNLNKIQITSHRGFSYGVPENTLPAIERAIEDKTDYVEVDVRVTKDGELVLLHDSNLKRTTGLNQYIWKVNYAKVASLDAGSWVAFEYKDTRIPTLREVLELCKGKVVLNLELKYMNANEKIEKKTVDLIKEYDMDWQCVISSNNLTCLKRVKKLDPNIQTGYILNQLYPGLSKNETIDFFSLKSSLITNNVVREIHQNGKKLYVWTVNSKPELERLQRFGVDNIITDNPVYAREVLEQSASEQYFLTLLKVIKD